MHLESSALDSKPMSPSLGSMASLRAGVQDVGFGLGYCTGFKIGYSWGVVGDNTGNGEVLSTGWVAGI